ncbi:membrane protein insertase YidC [Smaragdicoccus niigatensis]|uniref:membrane protein insertase YidC n=1 Tax=Smaragdicoccus niigatensis TaxID=359359 RepID=UPI0003636BFD|nr:membrane protein insertase YidC [Smaragdicoccus niigatensis]
MLNFVYYPVSGILWVWHKAFGFLFGPDSGLTWVLAVVFLVFTLRLLLYRPFVKQVRTTRQMQELQPQIKALQKKYGKDKQRLAMEMQKLQKEHGFNPLMGCLPVLVQAPVFIGLYHVLSSFARTGTRFGQSHAMTALQNAQTPNYFFSAEDVQSFLKAKVFGVPLAAFMNMSVDYKRAFNVPELGILTHDLTVVKIAIVAAPLMILASLATHMNSRFSVARQSAAVAANPQTAIMNKLALYAFPLGVLVGGPFLPVAILFYWVANNAWTYGQQHVVYRKMDREDEAKKLAALEKRSELAPRPGAKPTANRTQEITTSTAVEIEDDTDTSATRKNPNRGGTRPGQVKSRKNNPNRGRPNQGPKRRP